MTALWKHARRTLARLHRDERGAEGLEKLLIIGAIALPLLFVLIMFRERLIDWVTEAWGEVSEDNVVDDPNF
jgi:Flp pilus assembly pilin Flp